MRVTCPFSSQASAEWGGPIRVRFLPRRVLNGEDPGELPFWIPGATGDLLKLGTGKNATRTKQAFTQGLAALKKEGK